MKKTIKVCYWYGNIHPYFIKTDRARHPVHMIEGGSYITEDMTEYDHASDMGVFGLNKADYEWFKAHLQDMEIEVGNNSLTSRKVGQEK